MRLIDADALELDAEYDDGEFWAYSRTQIENTPTVEPKKGHWIKIHWKAFRCSECNKISEYFTDFCPNCGADMREGEQE